MGEKRKAELEEQTTKKADGLSDELTRTRLGRLVQGKSLSGKQQRKKEITKLYGCLVLITVWQN